MGLAKNDGVNWTIIPPECLVEEVKIAESPVLDLHVVANNLHGYKI